MAGGINAERVKRLRGRGFGIPSRQSHGRGRRGLYFGAFRLARLCGARIGRSSEPKRSAAVASLWDAGNLLGCLAHLLFQWSLVEIVGAGSATSPTGVVSRGLSRLNHWDRASRNVDGTEAARPPVVGKQYRPARLGPRARIIASRSMSWRADPRLLRRELGAAIYAAAPAHVRPRTQPWPLARLPGRPADVPARPSARLQPRHLQPRTLPTGPPAARARGPCLGNRPPARDRAADATDFRPPPKISRALAISGYPNVLPGAISRGQDP